MIQNDPPIYVLKKKSLFWRECITCVKSLQSCPTLCDSVDCSPSGSSSHGILQARILEWFACPPPRDLPNPGIEPVSLKSPALAGRILTTRATWEAHLRGERGLFTNDSGHLQDNIAQKHLNSPCFTHQSEYVLSQVLSISVYVNTILRVAQAKT